MVAAAVVSVPFCGVIQCCLSVIIKTPLRYTRFFQASLGDPRLFAMNERDQVGLL